MSSLEQFENITKTNEPLAPYTWLKVGGAAEYFIEPTSQDQLVDVVRCCHENNIPLRVLGGGSNLLVHDEGVSGVVLKLGHSIFSQIEISGDTVNAGAAVLLSQLISSTVKAGLAGLETLVGIPGTVGGAVRGNAGGRRGEIGSTVQKVTVLTTDGQICVRSEDELSFGYRTSSINEPVIIDVELKLTPGDPEAITQRMRQQWILKKEAQPLSFQSAGCIFKNPRGESAGELIEKAGLKGTRLGAAEVSDRHANFIVTSSGATAHDVKELIGVIQAKVLENCGVDLDLEIQIW